MAKAAEKPKNRRASALKNKLAMKKKKNKTSEAKKLKGVVKKNKLTKKTKINKVTIKKVSKAVKSAKATPRKRQAAKPKRKITPAKLSEPSKQDSNQNDLKRKASAIGGEPDKKKLKFGRAEKSAKQNQNTKSLENEADSKVKRMLHKRRPRVPNLAKPKMMQAESAEDDNLLRLDSSSEGEDEGVPKNKEDLEKIKADQLKKAKKKKTSSAHSFTTYHS